MRSKFRIEYSPEAIDDLRGIYAYIAFHLRERKTAKALIDRIRKDVRSLSEMPERYALSDLEPWASMGMRHRAIDNFIVFYLVEKDDRLVQIVRVLYGGQDIESIAQHN